MEKTSPYEKREDKVGKKEGMKVKDMLNVWLHDIQGINLSIVLWRGLRVLSKWKVIKVIFSWILKQPRKFMGDNIEEFLMGGNLKYFLKTSEKYGENFQGK